MAARNMGLGVAFATATAALMATQDPLSGPAAKALGGVQFVWITQASLLAATPLLLLSAEARRDFASILKSGASRWRLAALTALGLAGLALYNLGLRGAHPVVVTAILNLSPFWAALAAWLVSRVRPPAGAGVFVTALLGAFAGSIVVAASQADLSHGVAGLLAGSWYLALPVPFFTALSATLVGVWFKGFHQSAAVAAALFAPTLATLPLGALYLATQPHGFAFPLQPTALLVAGTIAAAALGRFTYQLALQATQGDNGFVTMFFLAAPGLSGLYSWALSPFVKSLSFRPDGLYFLGLAMTAISLLFFLRRAQAKTPH